MWKRQKSVLLLLITAATMLGCASLPMERRITVSQNTTTDNETGVLAADKARVLVRDFAPYARMAVAVYRYEYGEDQASRNQHACDYLDGAPVDKASALPRGWKRLDHASMHDLGIDSKLMPCRSEEGLQYEVYIKPSDTQGLAAAVISFSGTEYDRYNWKPDWTTNLSGLTFGAVLSKEYRQTRELLIPLARALAAKLPVDTAAPRCTSGRYPYALDVIGHSLGGGLAQHLAYTADTCLVRRAVTFNSSPVNGWFYLWWRDGLLKTRDPRIDRVYANGEVLSFLRRATTPFNTSRENRVDYKIDSPAFAEALSNTVARHGIRPLADELESWGDGSP